MIFTVLFCVNICLSSCQLAPKDKVDENGSSLSEGGGEQTEKTEKEHEEEKKDGETEEKGDLEDGGDGDTEEEHTGPVILTSGAVTSFKLVYDTVKCSDVLSDAIDSVKKAFSDVGVNVESFDDSKTKASDYEILIGKTSRVASLNVLRELSERDYAFLVKGKQVVIIGGSDYSTALAIDCFLERVKRDGDKLFFDEPTQVKYVYENEKTDTVYGTLDEKRSAFADPYGRPMITAHRSEHVYSVENSIAGIISAVELGVDIIEIDLQKTKDGYYVLCHDTTLTSSTNVSSLAGIDGLPTSHKVSDWTLDEIMRLTLKGSTTGEHPVLLDDVFDIVRGKAILLFDKIKTDTDTNEIVDLAMKARALDSVMFQFANSFNACERAYELSGIPILFMHWKDNTDAAVSFVSGSGYRDRKYAIQAIQITTPTTLPDKELTDRVRAHCRLYTNTLKTPAAAGGSYEADVESSWLALIGCGINIIQTDNPFKAVAAARGIGLPFSYSVEYNTSPVLKDALASLTLTGDGKFYYTTENREATEEDSIYLTTLNFDKSVSLSILYIDKNSEKYTLSINLLAYSEEYYKMLGLDMK